MSNSENSVIVSLVPEPSTCQFCKATYYPFAYKRCPNCKNKIVQQRRSN